jgi:hypothetical protein
MIEGVVRKRYFIKSSNQVIFVPDLFTHETPESDVTQFDCR